MMPWLVVEIFILLIHMKAFDINQFFKYNVGKERERNDILCIQNYWRELQHCSYAQMSSKAKNFRLEKDICTGVSTIYGTAQIH